MFRILLIKSLFKISHLVDSDLAQKIMSFHLDIDCSQVEVQQEVGKFLARTYQRKGKLEWFVNKFIVQFIKTREKEFSMEDNEGDQIMQSYTVDLNSRRNCVIYLNEVL